MASAWTWATSTASCARSRTTGSCSSEWDATVPGPAKRVYELTDGGRELLDEWAAGLERAGKRISLFLKRYRKEVDDAAP